MKNFPSTSELTRDWVEEEWGINGLRRKIRELNWKPIFFIKIGLGGKIYTYIKPPLGTWTWKSLQITYTTDLCKLTERNCVKLFSFFFNYLIFHKRGLKISSKERTIIQKKYWVFGEMFPKNTIFDFQVADPCRPTHHPSITPSI